MKTEATRLCDVFTDGSNRHERYVYVHRRLLPYTLYSIVVLFLKLYFMTPSSVSSQSLSPPRRNSFYLSPTVKVVVNSSTKTYSNSNLTQRNLTISGPSTVMKISPSLHNIISPLRPNWNIYQVPSFCEDLLRKPIAMTDCTRDRVTGQCHDGPTRFVSSDLQDYYLYTRHFRRLSRRGTYIEIGQNDPVVGSNTFVMDVCLGWEGVCVEANPKYHDRIKILRNCHVVPTCVSEKNGENVTFALAGGVGGIMDTNKHAHHWKKNNIKREMKTMTCRSMGDVQKERKIKMVDFLSLDVEGHELNVLKGFNWKSGFVINVIAVEVSPKSLIEIEHFLREKGYKRHVVNMKEYKNKPKHKDADGTLFGDAIFFHNTVKFGHPE